MILGDFGEVTLVDWGLAKFIGQPDEHSVTHSPTGRPGCKTRP